MAETPPKKSQFACVNAFEFNMALSFFLSNRSLKRARCVDGKKTNKNIVKSHQEKKKSISRVLKSMYIPAFELKQVVHLLGKFVHVLQ